MKPTSQLWKRKWRSGAFRSPTWRPRSRTSRQKPAPTQTPNCCAPSLRRSETCRSNDPRSSTVSTDLAAIRTRSPIASARRTRRCRNLRTRRAMDKRRPAPTIRTSCFGTSASTPIGVTPRLTSASRRRLSSSALGKSLAPWKRRFSAQVCDPITPVAPIVTRRLQLTRHASRRDWLVVFVEQGDAVRAHYRLNLVLILRDQLIQGALPILIGTPHSHDDPKDHRGAALLL